MKTTRDKECVLSADKLQTGERAFIDTIVDAPALYKIVYQIRTEVTLKENPNYNTHGVFDILASPCENSCNIYAIGFPAMLTRFMQYRFPARSGRLCLEIQKYDSKKYHKAPCQFFFYLTNLSRNKQESLESR